MVSRIPILFNLGKIPDSNITFHIKESFTPSYQSTEKGSPPPKHYFCLIFCSAFSQAKISTLQEQVQISHQMGKPENHRLKTYRLGEDILVRSFRVLQYLFFSHKTDLISFIGSGKRPKKVQAPIKKALG